jgi:hypothetical protein
MALLDYGALHALALRAPAGSVVAVSFADGVSLVLHAPSARRDGVDDPSVAFTRLSALLRTAAPGTAARIAFPDGLNLSVSTNARARLQRPPGEPPTLAPMAPLASSAAPPMAPLASSGAPPMAPQASSAAPLEAPLASEATPFVASLAFDAAPMVASVLVTCDSPLVASLAFDATPAKSQELRPTEISSLNSHSPDRKKRLERRSRFGERPDPEVTCVEGYSSVVAVPSAAEPGASVLSASADPLASPPQRSSLSPSSRKSHRKLHQIPREVRKASPYHAWSSSTFPPNPLLLLYFSPCFFSPPQLL